MWRLLLMLIFLLIFAPIAAQDETELPEGEIVFVSNRDGNGEIYIMNADGRNQINLTNHSATDLSPKWSPSGELVGFVSNRSGDYAIYVMDEYGQSLKRVSDLISTQFYWGADDSTIFYITRDDVDVNLYRLDIITGTESHLLRTWRSESLSTVYPLISENAIIYYTDRSIWRLDLNSGASTEVIPQSVIFSDLDVNPICNLLVNIYQPVSETESFDSNLNLFLTNLSTNETYQITDLPSDEAEPKISPDGQYVAFISDYLFSERPNNSPRYRRLYIYDIRSEQLRSILRHKGSFSSLSWSPDSRFIALAQYSTDFWEENAEVDIIVVDIITEEINSLFEEPEHDIYTRLQWRPQSSFNREC